MPEKENSGAQMAVPEEILAELSEIARGKREYPNAAKNGEVVFSPPPLTARMKALELLGKHYGLFGGGEGNEADDADPEVEIRVVGGL